MKVTTKLFISLGLSLIFGMQAFANGYNDARVLITNKDCPSVSLL